MQKNTRTIRISQGKKAITLPVNPEELRVKYGMSGQSLELMGGEYFTCGRPRLRRVSIETWLPEDGSDFAPEGWSLRRVLEQLIAWQWERKPVRLSITGLTNVHYYITGLTTIGREGERSIGLELELTEARELGARAGEPYEYL